MFLIFLIFFKNARILHGYCARCRARPAAPRGSVFIQIGSGVDRTKPTLGQPGCVQSLVLMFIWSFLSKHYFEFLPSPYTHLPSYTLQLYHQVLQLSKRSIAIRATEPPDLGEQLNIISHGSKSNKYIEYIVLALLLTVLKSRRCFLLTASIPDSHLYHRILLYFNSGKQKHHHPDMTIVLINESNVFEWDTKCHPLPIHFSIHWNPYSSACCQKANRFASAECVLAVSGRFFYTIVASSPPPTFSQPSRATLLTKLV